MNSASLESPASDRLLKTNEVAELIGVTSHTISVWVRGGIIPSKRLGGARRFVRSEINEWIRAGGQSGIKSRAAAAAKRNFNSSQPRKGHGPVHSDSKAKV